MVFSLRVLAFQKAFEVLFLERLVLIKLIDRPAGRFGGFLGFLRPGFA